MFRNRKVISKFAFRPPVERAQSLCAVRVIWIQFTYNFHSHIMLYKAQKQERERGKKAINGKKRTCVKLLTSCWCAVTTIIHRVYSSVSTLYCCCDGKGTHRGCVIGRSKNQMHRDRSIYLNYLGAHKYQSPHHNMLTAAYPHHAKYINKLIFHILCRAIQFHP